MEKKKPAVFLDRDGVLAQEKGYVCRKEDLEIFPYTKESVSRMQIKGYLAIVVTNQSGVARGYFTEEALLAMNRYLQEETGVDAIYYCPHYAQGNVGEYAVMCNCRKPMTGMIERACTDYEIDLENSYMVGDRAGDIKLGQAVGIRTVLVETGYGMKRMEEKVRPDYIFRDLTEFAAFLPQYIH